MPTRKILYSCLIGGALSVLAATPGAPQGVEPPRGGTIQRPPGSASFVGIGASLDPKLSADGYVVVRVVIAQAGADVKKALRPGDKIAQVDGKPVRDTSISQVVELIRGEENTPVRLTLLRAGVKKPVVVTVKRRMIYAEGEGPASR